MVKRTIERGVIIMSSYPENFCFKYFNSENDSCARCPLQNMSDCMTYLIGYEKAMDDMEKIILEMRETAQAMMYIEGECACDRLLTQLEKLKEC